MDTGISTEDCSSDVFDMSESPVPSLETVTMEDLPNEILLKIFSYLPVDDMARVSRVSRKWRDLLRQERELWRHKEWSTRSVARTRDVLMAGSGMPQLEEVQLLYDGEYGIHVAWPEVKVRLYVGAPFLWEPYFHPFDTECLVVSQLVAENISGYIECVEKKTLRKICVTEQHLEYFYQRKGPCFTYVPTSPHYSPPIRYYNRASVVHSALECRQQDGFDSDDESLPSSSDLSRRASVSEASDPRPAEGETDGDASGEVETCPMLEVLNVHCKRLSHPQLHELCSLGPLRVLRIHSLGLRDLSVLRCCYSHLEELVISQCGMLPEEELSELLVLKQLRILSLGKCSLSPTALLNLTAGLPNLESISLNGHEIS